MSPRKTSKMPPPARLEWAMGGAWTLKAEYLYYDLGSLSHRMIDPNFASTFNASADFTGHIVRLGVNYRF